MLRVTDNSMTAGQESLRIQSPATTWVYHKEGCGFCSVLDSEGRDWVSYRPGHGPRGEYRGIPNMGLGEFGHPGYAHGARTTVSEQTADMVRLTSVSPDGAWWVHWNLRATHATMTAERIAKPVWLLYEGTPGGHFSPQSQFLCFSDGTRLGCNERFERPMPAPKWVGVCDPSLERSIVLKYHGDQTHTDCYWPMGGDGGMTVLGIGRKDTDGHGFLITEVPFRFSFGLVDRVDFDGLREFAHEVML